jgi:hypothetical protein
VPDVHRATAAMLNLDLATVLSIGTMVSTPLQITLSIPSRFACLGYLYFFKN